MYYINSNIDKLHRVFDQNDRKGFLRLDLNENPGGLPQRFVQEVLSGVTPQFLSQYPETSHFIKVLAKHLGTKSDYLCLTNGSVEGIRYIIESFTEKNGEIVGVFPSFAMFQVFSEMYERNFVKVPYNKDLSLDISNIIAHLSHKTQLLILLNPNNPMGNVYTDEEFEKLMTNAREKHITVLVDEAYHYFYPKSFIKYALNEEHVFITRTFSKLFSLAGCRLGYVVGRPEGIKVLQNICTPHNVNCIALKFAEAVLESPSLLNSLINGFLEGRVFLINQLDWLGYVHKGEAGNFIFIKPKTDALKIVERMKKEKKILIKAYPNVGDLGTCLRVTIGEKRYMKQFLEALIEVDN